MTDPVISGYGDPLYRFEDLLTRRKIAALSGQHRVVQRLSKQLAIFRAAFGLPQCDDEPTPARNHRIARDPKEDSSLEQASVAGMPREDFVAKIIEIESAVASAEPPVYDREWMRKQTVFGLAYALRMAGSPAVTRKTFSSVAMYSFDSKAGRVTLTVPDNKWCASVAVDGAARPLVDYRPTEKDANLRGVPPSMASDNWDGKLTAAEAQQYCVAWARLARELSTEK